MSKQFTLGKNERLKSRKLIEQLFKSGISFNAFPYRVFYVINNSSAAAQPAPFNVQFGTGASTKNFKKAVDRNRIKRVTREAWRLQKKELEQKLKERNSNLNVFFIYTSKELPEYKLVYEKVTVILSKLMKVIDENSTSNS